METVAAHFAVVIEGGGGGLVANTTTIDVVVFTFASGQFLVVLYLTIRAELKLKTKNRL